MNPLKVAETLDEKILSIIAEFRLAIRGEGEWLTTSALPFKRSKGEPGE